MSTLAHPHVPAADPAIALLDRLRRGWRVGVLVRGALLATALLLLLGLALVLVDLIFSLDAPSRVVLRWLPPSVAVGVLAWCLTRAVRAPAPRRFALLAEERVPELDNRLLTLLDVAPTEGAVARAFRGRTGRVLTEVPTGDVVPLSARLRVCLLVASALFAAVFALGWPDVAAEAWTRWTEPRDAYASAWREVRTPSNTEAGSPAVATTFDELRWSVRPPGYTGLPPAEARGDATPSVLPGSRIRLRSRFGQGWTQVAAQRIGGGSLSATRDGNEWATMWTMRPSDRGVVLEAIVGGATVARRVAAVLPSVDRPPVVTLTEPARDLVFASPRGRVGVRAVARDDYGVGTLRLAWIRSRGGGESFTFAEGETPWARLERGGREWRGEARLDLAALGLQPGDVLHLRAVARDRNDVTGPSESVSETRVLRIARSDELDQVNTLVAYPPPEEQNPLLSQRMLILLTERLRDEQPRLDNDELTRRGGQLGMQQGQLRARVGEQVFTRQTGAMEDPAHVAGEHAEGEGAEAATAGVSPEDVLAAAAAATGQGTEEEITHRHDEAPVIDLNRTLLTVFNKMWAAERALNQGEPAAALPHQRTALRLLQEAQAGERVFARGRVAVEPVDVAAARGGGELDEAAPSPRSRGEETDVVAPLLGALDAAAERLRVGDGGAAQLAALAAEVLGDREADPRAGAALARAADAAASGRRGEALRWVAEARARLASEGRGGNAPPLPAPVDPAAADYFRRLGAHPR